MKTLMNSLVQAVMYMSQEQFEDFLKKSEMSFKDKKYLTEERENFNRVDEVTQERFLSHIRLEKDGEVYEYLDATNLLYLFHDYPEEIHRLGELCEQEKDLQLPYMVLQEKYRNILRQVEYVYNRLQGRK